MSRFKSYCIPWNGTLSKSTRYDLLQFHALQTISRNWHICLGCAEKHLCDSGSIKSGFAQTAQVTSREVIPLNAVSLRWNYKLFVFDLFNCFCFHFNARLFFKNWENQVWCLEKFDVRSLQEATQTLLNKAKCHVPAAFLLVFVGPDFWDGSSAIDVERNAPESTGTAFGSTAAPGGWFKLTYLGWVNTRTSILSTHYIHHLVAIVSKMSALMSFEVLVCEGGGWGCLRRLAPCE